jgi:hypothetical protein
MMRRLTVALLLLAAMAGCVTMQPGPEPLPGWSSLTPTVTTKQEIRAKYGKPQDGWSDGGRNEVWVYDLGETKEARFHFIGDLLANKSLFYRGRQVWRLP